VCIDDASRLTYGEVLPDERKDHAVPFQERAVGWFARQGVSIERVMTDNGSAYLSRQWREACGALALRHLRTRPYSPRLREWAYARPNASSAERTAALLPWLEHYNHARPHTALAQQPPWIAPYPDFSDPQLEFGAGDNVRCRVIRLLGPDEATAALRMIGDGRIP
jgi:hypothetical protein